MLIGVPPPKEEELIYSVMARTKQHFGFRGYETFARILYDSRNMVGSVPFPLRLEALSQCYHPYLGLKSDTLRMKHTLFPLFAPFIFKTRKKKLIQIMDEKNPIGRAESVCGTNRSIVPFKKSIWICPGCLKAQEERYGHSYIERIWMVPGVTSCSRHGELINTNTPVNSYGYRDFLILPPSSHYSKNYQKPASEEERRLNRRILELLTLSNKYCPTENQWDRFYQELATKNNAMKKVLVNHEVVKSIIVDTWGWDYLKSIGLVHAEKGLFWVKSMFLKHSSTFSFLQHSCVIEALCPDKSWEQCFIKLESYPAKHRKKQKNSKVLAPINRQDAQDRELWARLVPLHGIKKCQRGYLKAVYSRLYRRSRAWLLQFNAQYIQTDRPRRRLIDWEAREREWIERISAKLSETDLENVRVRRSQSWLLKLINKKTPFYDAPIELVELKQFLENNVETKEQWQIRKLELAFKECVMKKLSPKKRRLVRLARLLNKNLLPRAKERLVSLSDDYISINKKQL